MSASIWSPDGSDGPVDYVYRRIWINIVAGQTLVDFTLTDPTFFYTPGLKTLEIGLGGLLPLIPVTDYAETSPTSITLTRAPTEDTVLYAAVGRPISPEIEGIDATLIPYTSSSGNTNVADALDQPLVSLTAAAYNRDVPIYNPTETGLNSAAVITQATSTGTHTVARVLNYNKVVVEGSGLAAGSQRADFAGADVMFKTGWPNLSASQNGEMDCRQFAFRQTNGDATFFLGLGQGNNGFLAVYEARIESVNESGTVLQSVNVQTGVVNDLPATPASNFQRGYRASKAVGSGGIGVSVDQESGAAWLYQFGAFKQGTPWWYVDGADGSHLFFKDGDVTKYVRLKAGDNTLVFTDPSGNNVATLDRSPTTYTPTLGATVGSLTTSAVSYATYRRSGKRVTGTVELSTANIGTASGALTVTLPSTARATYFSATGFNASTAQALAGAVVPSTNSLRVYLYTGAFPVANGHTITVSFDYEEA